MAYSAVLMEHFTRPRNGGWIESSDRSGLVGIPGRGPFFLLSLRIQDGVVADARYRTHGCGPTIAAGSVMTEMIKGRRLQDCLAVTVEQLVEALGGVPEHKLHSPAMAVAALRNALEGAGM